MATSSAIVTGYPNLGDGTVSAPGLAFQNDQDTGLYRIGANTIGIATNGTRVGEIGVGYGGFTGNIIQVLSIVKSDTFTTTSGTYTDVTGFNLNITPKYNTSKILVIVDIGHLVSGGGTCQARLLRDSTEIYSGDAVSGKTPSLHRIYFGGTTTGEHYYGTWHHVSTYLDSPSTTSSITYKIQVKDDDGSTVYFNRNVSDSGNYSGRSASSIILMEVQQ